MTAETEPALCRLCGGPRTPQDTAVFDGGAVCSLCHVIQQGLAAKARRRLDPLAVVGLCAAGLPLAVSFRTTKSESSADGTTEHRTSLTIDYADLVGGGLALLFGVLLAIKVARTRPMKRADAAALAVVLLLGAYHAATGYRSDESRRPAHRGLGFSMTDGDTSVTVTRTGDRAPPSLACEVGQVDACRGLCAGGDMTACQNLAISYGYGKGVAADSVRAVTLYEQACTGGQTPACNELGVLLWNGGVGVPVDLGRARRLFVGACPAGNAHACLNLAVFLAEGLGGPADPGGATVAAQKGCGADIDACVTLGRGEFKRKHYLGAALLYEQACSGGQSPACNELGVLLRNGGGGVPVDLERARRLFAGACPAGNAHACLNLTVFLAEGLGGPADPGGATVAAQKGCIEDTDGRGCVSQPGRSPCRGAGRSDRLGRCRRRPCAVRLRPRHPRGVCRVREQPVPPRATRRDSVVLRASVHARAR